MKQETKQWLLEHLHSAVITFLAVFLPFLALAVKDTSFEDITRGGVAGASMIVGRLLIKVIYETLREILSKKIRK